MRNLKKFLALVLAMVMAMSLMVTANAATKSSKFPNEEIDPGLVEAVDVLAGLEVFQGQNATGAEDGEKVFAPKSDITRKEVAALIYRVFSTDVTDTKTHLYKDYANFTDVNSESWYAGYVGLCANHNIIKGSNNGRFYPDNKVTGYEVLAMILRVVGYDEEGEFTGSGWQTRVASKAALLHITDNLNTTNYAGTLNQPATREVVAELIFQTMVRVPQVTHNSLGYNDKTGITSEIYNPTLGQEKFGLSVTGWKYDKWGDPYYTWTKGGVMSQPYYYRNYYYTDVNEEGRTDVGYPHYTTTGSVVATIKPTPDMEFTTTMRECDVAHALESKGFKDGSELFDLWVNQNLVENYKVEATDTVTRVGGQGRLTKVYYKVWSAFAGAPDNVVTMVDTFLAQVTRVTPRVLDHNGHVVQAAQADLVVYDRGEAMPGSDYENKMRDLTGAGGTITDPTSSANYSDSPINFINNDTYGTRCTNLTKGAYRSVHSMTSTAKDYTYTVGEYILVQGKTDPTQGRDWSVDGDTTHQPDNSKTGLYHAVTQAAKERMAFETNMLLADPDSDLAPVDGIKAVEAKQTSVTWNDGTHNVGNETKDDQLTLFMDYAGSNLSNTFTWYFDQYGNLIGIGPKANTVNYGVITSLYSAFKQGSAATTGEAVAMANVTYADGTTGTVEISKFIVAADENVLTLGRAPLANHGTTTTNDPYSTYPMQDNITIAADGSYSMELTPVYDYNTGAGLVMTATSGTPTVGNPKHAGELYVAPVASINKDQDKQDSTHFGIIGRNLFKFITTEDGVVTAIEIAGNKPGSATAPAVDNTNSLRYDGHYHFQNGTNDATYTGKLSKTQGSITTQQLRSTVTGGDPVWLESDVKIILNMGGTLKVYQGLSALPSDITIDANSEVDWVDTDGDLRADYVYLYGETTGAVTYGLFYYNGGPAVWNGTSGTLTGWLNGNENTTLTFTSEDEFKAVRNSADYYGHMFAVRMMDGVVDELMMRDDDKGDGDQTTKAEWTYELLRHWNTDHYENKSHETTDIINVGTDIVWGTTFDAAGAATNPLVPANHKFVLGTPGGNPYDANTRVAYHSEGRYDESVSFVDNKNEITYTRAGDQVYGTVTVNNASNTGSHTLTTYYVGANTKFYGIGMGAVHGEAILEYLEKSTRNDVTIVYDATNNGIIEIYVATDPNITPSDDPTVAMGLTLNTLSFGTNKFTLNYTVSGQDLLSTDRITVEIRDLSTGALVVRQAGLQDTGTDGTSATTSDTVEVPYTATSAIGNYSVTMSVTRGVRTIVTQTATIRSLT